MKKRKLLTLTMASALVFSFSAFAKPVANSYANDVTANSTEKAVDYKNLEDGVYSLGATIYHSTVKTTPGKLSMADGAIDKTKTRLVVKNGEYRVQLTFIPLTMKFFGDNFKGFLGNLRYDSTYNPVTDKGSKPKDFGQCKILEWYGEKESNTSANANYQADDLMKIYQQKFPDRKYYPKVLEYPVNKNTIDKNGKIMTKTEVFVPIMEALGEPGDDMGTQYCRPTFDFKELKTISLGVTDEKAFKDFKENAIYKIGYLDNLTKEQKDSLIKEVKSKVKEDEIEKIYQKAKELDKKQAAVTPTPTPDVTPTPTPEVKAGLQKDEKGTKYQRANGSFAKAEWEQVGETWYHFDENGYMQTGWLNLGGTWYYLNADGKMAKDTWIGTYYVDGSGAWVIEGWQQSGYGWWYQRANGTYPASEWEQINGIWYYFDANGYMLADEATPDGYYVDANGAWVN